MPKTDDTIGALVSDSAALIRSTCSAVRSIFVGWAEWNEAQQITALLRRDIAWKMVTADRRGRTGNEVVMAGIGVLGFIPLCPTYQDLRVRAI